MTDGTGTTTYTYDSLGRLTSTTNGAGAAVAYGYDLDNDVTSITYPNGQVVTQGYDAVGNLTSVRDWLGHTVTFTYDSDNDLLSQKVGSSPAVTDSYTYDADGAVMSITDLGGKKGATLLQPFVYARNADGLVSSATPNGQSAQPYYDSQSQVTQDAQGSYTYNPNGGVTSLFTTDPMTYNADSSSRFGQGIQGGYVRLQQ